MAPAWSIWLCRSSRADKPGRGQRDGARLALVLPPVLHSLSIFSLCPHAHSESVSARQAATLASLAEAGTDGAGPAHALPPLLHSLCVSGIESKHSAPPASGMRDAVRPQAINCV